MPDKKVVYKKIDDIELKLHIFNPEDHKASDKRPAIVFFHGGGWQHGSPESFYERSEHLAERGMVAIAAEYRVKNEHGVEPKECVKDAKSAIRWIRKHAEELGINPDKLAAGGASAGGQMSAAAGSSDGLNEEGEDTSTSCRPNAVVLFAAPLDTGPGGFVHNWTKKYWKDFSPLHNIDEKTPPTLIMLGTDDGITPVETAKKYKAKMKEAGVRCDLVLYEGQPHRFHVKHINAELYEDTLQKMDAFLVSLEFLEKAKETTQQSEEELPPSPPSQ